MGKQTEIPVVDLSGTGSRMTAEHKALVEAHNKSLHGLRIGVKKSDQQRISDTPLFISTTQTTMF